MKHLITTIASAILVGCSKNDITIANSGTNVWKKIEIRAGGQQLIIDRLERGEYKEFRFKTKQEGGGLLKGNINGKKVKQEFGYYTPNLDSNIAIILDDSSDRVEIVDMDSTVQSIDDLIAERKNGETSAVKKNLRVLGEELKTEEK
ncbi:MAG: hypothetical protein QF600_02565 [Verrucomicrobiota bacterium]|jgi:hypothetical protein|nr:hypothetical protein [Verrucomicrobiota bacterium]